MSAPILRRVEALEGRGAGGAQPMLVIISFVSPRGGRPGPVGIEAAPPHFPVPVDKLPDEKWDAFTNRLQRMLSHLTMASVVVAFARTNESPPFCGGLRLAFKATCPPKRRGPT